MGILPERRDPAPSGPPAFRDRAEAGALLGAALREVLGHDQAHDPERVRAATVPPAVPLTAVPAGTVPAGTVPAGAVPASTGPPGPLPPDPGPPAPVVFAIPRGGVAVAAGVARALGVPLGVLMV